LGHCKRRPGRNPGKSKSTKPAKEKEEEDDDVSANEDLMREHGVLNRILLIYDEAGRRIQAKESFRYGDSGEIPRA